MPGPHFLSYSRFDGEAFALRLHDALEAGFPPFLIWLDKIDLKPGQDWDEQIADAIRVCDSLLFVMTRDSVNAQSTCKLEWTRALKYKKPIIPLLLHPDAELPFRLATRQYLDFTGEFDSALTKLREHLHWLASPEGKLQELHYRLEDAQRELSRATDVTQHARVETDVALLHSQIDEQEHALKNPQSAAQQVEANIAAGLERERQPLRIVVTPANNKFINPPPGIAPSYFQGRQHETKLIGDFLKDDALRLLTIVGRGGIGKTALVCRVLKSLENGQLPDDGGPLHVDGIVYLSATGTRRLNVPNLFADLCKLLPEPTAKELDILYKNPQATTEAKMRALLAAFPTGRTVMLLDNFEDLLDSTTRHLTDTELHEALCALLNLSQHTIKVIMTTRVPPADVSLVQPARQRRCDLDEGLDLANAGRMLREMDADGKLGLKNAPDDFMKQAHERTRGFPRALEALFAILSADRDTSLPEILNDTQKLLPENVVAALVGEAFSRLDAVAQQVMQALSVYNRPVTANAVDYLLQPYAPSLESAPVLKRLVNMHFVRKEAGRYYLHPIDREYAFGRVPRGEVSDRNETETPKYTQFALLHRGAEYFKQARLPREQWKTIEDLEPQLAELELRFAGEDYDNAAKVLLEIDYNYLNMWGYYRLLAELYEQLQDKINDSRLKQSSIGSLGTVYYCMGQYQKSIAYYEQALVMARDIKDSRYKVVWLGGLGNAYSLIGQTAQAIEYYEQALILNRMSGNKHLEGVYLGNLGNRYAELGQTARAIEYYRKAIAILQEIGNRLSEGIHVGNLAEVLIDEERYTEAIQYSLECIKIGNELSGSFVGSEGNRCSALTYLYINNLTAARSAVETARRYDEPRTNHKVVALLGVIASRQQDRVAAQEAFTATVKQAEEMLQYSAQNYTMLNAKALSLCGLALCENNHMHATAAAQTFCAARAINKDVGIVNRVLRLFDALAVADENGILAEVRKAAAGEE